MSTESPNKNAEQPKQVERKLIIAMVPRPKKPKEQPKPS
jgi:hypothetical protein